MITSVGIDRDVFVQRDGEKHAEAFSGWSDNIFVQDAKNTAIIADLHGMKDEMAALDKKRRELEQKIHAKAKTLKSVDTKKIVASVLGAEQE